MFQIMNVEPEPPTAVDASLPAAVDGVLARSLAKDPNERTPDVATFAKDLASALTLTRAVAASSRSQGASIARENPSEARSTPAISKRSAISPREAASVRIAGPVIAVVVLLAAVRSARGLLRGGPQR